MTQKKRNSKEIEEIIRKTKNMPYRDIMNSYGMFAGTIKKYRDKLGFTQPKKSKLAPNKHVVKLKYAGVPDELVNIAVVKRMKLMNNISKRKPVRDTEVRGLAVDITGKDQRSEAWDIIDEYLKKTGNKLVRSSRSKK